MTAADGLIGGALAARAGTPALVVVAVSAVALAVLTRRGGPRLLGPVFRFDVLRQSRRGRPVVLRVLYAALLLAALYLVYLSHFPGHDPLGNPFANGPVLRADELARFAHGCYSAFVVLQAAAVVALTPVLVAGAVTEEKEKRTLDDLLATDLRDREIVLGKLASRLLQLVGVLLAGLPVLAALQLWGGVDALRVGADFAVILLWLPSLGGLSILCSVLARTTPGAIGGSYGLIAVVTGLGLMLPQRHLATPVAFGPRLEEAIAADPADAVAITVRMLAGFALVQGVVAAVSAGYAVRLLRWAVQPPSPPWPIDGITLDWPKRAPANSFLRPLPPLLRALPPVGDRPLLWKETHHELIGGRALGAGTVFDLLWVMFGVVLSYPVLLFLVSLADPVLTGDVRQLLNGTVRLLGGLLAGAMILGVTLRLAGGVTRERERDTLDGLLALPLRRADILQAKLFGAVLRRRRFVYALAFVWLFGLASGGLHPLAALAVPAAVAAHTLFAAGLSLWLTVVCRSTLRATLFAVLGLMATVGAPSLLGLSAEAYLTKRDVSPEWVKQLTVAGLCPPATWTVLGFDAAELAAPHAYGPAARHRIAAALAGLPLYLAAGLGLIARAERRFRRDAGAAP